MLKNPTQTIENITRWIQIYFTENLPNASAVIGISGGKDSSVAAALCVKALGKDRVIGVTMPDGIQADLEDSHQLIRHLEIPHLEVNIADITSSFNNVFSANASLQQITKKSTLSGEAAINMPPRIRMAVLYAIAQSLSAGGLVVNTCNASEDYVGYSTKFGDAAGDFSPLSSFTVEEVLQIGQSLGLPASLVNKTPSDGLSGKSDEEKLGFTYAQLDHYIATGECNDPEIKNKIDRLHVRNLHKIQPMPTYKKHPTESL